MCVPLLHIAMTVTKTVRIQLSMEAHCTNDFGRFRGKYFSIYNVLFISDYVFLSIVCSTWFVVLYYLFD